MKSIGILIGTLDVGGTEMHLFNVLPKLSQKGFSIKVIVLSRPGSLAASFREKGLTVQSLFSESELKLFQTLPKMMSRPLRLMMAVYRLRKEFKKDNQQILHSFLPEAYVVGMVSAWLANFKGIRMMSRRSLNYYQKKRWGFKSIEEWLHTQMKIILGNSQAILQQLIEEEKVNSAKVQLIYNGLDVDTFKPKNSRSVIRQKFNIPEECFVLITTANLIPYKGHENILMSLNAIQKDLPKEWRLLCVGKDNGIQQSLIDKAKQFGIAEHIMWLGSRPDVPDLLAASDLAILASHEEGFSNALLEYMALGLPIIATAVGGNKEAILHHQCGWIVPPQDTVALGQTILEAFQNPHRAKEFGNNARSRLQENFTLDHCVQNYADLYHSLLQEAV